MVESAPIGHRPATLQSCNDDEHDCVFCGTTLRDEIELLNDTCHHCEAEQELCIRLEGFTELDHVCNALLNLLPTLTECVPVNKREKYEGLVVDIQSRMQKTRH